MDEGPQLVPPDEDDDSDRVQQETTADDPPPRRNDPPPEMRLTEQEEEWAWDVVQEVEEPGVGMKALTDFEYAVYALVTKGDTAAAVQRIKRMQRFRDKYEVQDTVEEGMAAIEEFVRTQPGVLINVQALDGDGSVAAMDWSKFFPARATVSEERWRLHAVFFYYLFRMHNPTLEAVRGGVRYLFEGKMTWENVDMDFEQRLYEEVRRSYPINFRQILVYNTNTVGDAFFDLCKPFFRELQIEDVLVLGCQLQQGAFDPSGDRWTLATFYLQPSYDAAMQKLLPKARTLLEQCFQYEENYRL